ncbi:hypothetical protein D3C87_1804700 [compost metagenome]
MGGILQKSAYAALWGYAQENGLVLTQANWEARRGGHYFVNIDADTFRVPDLRDMFRRFTGTDADTANARALGSKQSDQFRSHGHAQNAATLDRSGNANAAGGTLLAVRNLGEGLTTLATGGAETRGVNVAYNPRIHA